MLPYQPDGIAQKKLIAVARSLFEKDMGAAEMDFLGLTEDDLEEQHCDVYPENWQAVQVFIAMSTQWHSGMGGREGLRYEVLPVLEDRLGIKKKHRAEVFGALQVMEREALSVWAEQRE